MPPLPLPPHHHHTGNPGACDNNFAQHYTDGLVHAALICTYTAAAPAATPAAAPILASIWDSWGEGQWDLEGTHCMTQASIWDSWGEGECWSITDAICSGQEEQQQEQRLEEEQEEEDEQEKEQEEKPGRVSPPPRSIDDEITDVLMQLAAAGGE